MSFESVPICTAIGSHVHGYAVLHSYSTLE